MSDDTKAIVERLDRIIQILEGPPTPTDKPDIRYGVRVPEGFANVMRYPELRGER